MLAIKNNGVAQPIFAASVDEPFYYLHNFETVLYWILDRYVDLLESSEITQLQNFFHLSQKSRALFVRMVMRKGDVFRQSKLSYPEIGETGSALKPLITQKWVVSDPVLSLAELFELLTKDELGTIFTDLPKHGRKSDWFDAIATTYTDAFPFSAWCADFNDTVVALPDPQLFDRIRLLFFGNLYQGWSEFVLADLGIYQYETVALSNASRAFQCRDDIEHYELLYRCREAIKSDADNTALLLDIVSTINSTNPWITRRRAKVLFKLGQRCEKQKTWKTALTIYQQCGYPGARIRHIRVLEQLNHIEQALSLCESAFELPESEAEHQQILRMSPRLRRRLGKPAEKRLPLAAHAEIELMLPPPANHRSVEMAVQSLLDCEEGPVFYVENALINSLFGLLFWDAIFAPVPGAFFHPFQAEPADLLHPEFPMARQAQIETAFRDLAKGTHRAAILKTYRIKQWIQSPFVHWALLSEALLTLALDCIPADHLRLLFVRLLKDIKTNRSGLPDLIQFWPSERRYQMIEVKGPGDRLQDNQKRWLDYCVSHAIPVAVCYVQWQN